MSFPRKRESTATLEVAPSGREDRFFTGRPLLPYQVRGKFRRGDKWKQGLNSLFSKEVHKIVPNYINFDHLILFGPVLNTGWCLRFGIYNLHKQIILSCARIPLAWKLKTKTLNIGSGLISYRESVGSSLPSLRTTSAIWKTPGRQARLI